MTRHDILRIKLGSRKISVVNMKCCIFADRGKNRVVYLVYLKTSIRSLKTNFSYQIWFLRSILLNMASSRPDLAQYPTGFTILRIFQAVLSIITIVVTSFTINAVVLPANCLLIVAVRFSHLRDCWKLLTPHLTEFSNSSGLTMGCLRPPII